MDMEVSRFGRKSGVLLLIAVIFHLVGIVGIGILHHSGILRSTPAHLLLMLALLVIAFKEKLPRFLYWSFAVAVFCFVAEWIGVHYGWLFGGYWYGSVLGPKWLDIPLLIGVNWIVVSAGATSLAEKLRFPTWTLPLSAATLATLYDFLLEPLAMKLGYWMWEGGRIPAYNYLCWWGLTALSALLWQRLGLRGNLFAAGLFLIQIIFFIALRMLL